MKLYVWLLRLLGNGDAIYVDEVGYDLIIGTTKIEVKTEKNIIKKNLSTKSIQLKNTRGELQNFTQNFDYLLIANTQPKYLYVVTGIQFMITIISQEIKSSAH